MMFKRFLTYLAYLCLRGLLATCRLRFTGLENIRKAEAQGGGYVIAIWHEHTISGTLGHINQPIGLLVSASSDGDNLAYLSKKLGLIPVRGSSSRRGKEARGEMARHIQQGIPIALATDGPNGPFRSCKPGVVGLARATGTAILPLVAIPERAYAFNTWDKLKMPLPFTRLIVHHGEPLYVPADAEGGEFERYQTRVCDRLAETMAEGQRKFDVWSQIPKGSPRPRSRPTLSND